MDTLDKIYDMMYCELDDLSKKDKLDTKDVELIDKFVDIIKDINEIESSPNMGGYSQMNNRGNSYGYRMNRYNRGSSYGRGGNGYSRNDSKEMMLDHLQDIMDMAVDERDRKAVEKLMSQMSQN